MARQYCLEKKTEIDSFRYYQSLGLLPLSYTAIADLLCIGFRPMIERHKAKVSLSYT